MKIGDKIKEGRLNKGYTQEQVAEIINVSRSTVSSWEVNRTYPPLDILVTLGDLYDISLDVLLREDTKMVEEIVEVTRRSKNRKRVNIALMILFISITLFLGYKLWVSGKEVSYKQIKNIEVVLNGKEVNQNSEIVISADFDGFRDYDGYWIEGSNREYTLSLQQYYKISDRSVHNIAIPLAPILEDTQEINKIEFINPGDPDVVIYDVDNLSN
ncbi:helix-turn-helix domain-containing protein [Marinilactibacillus kalidii]|uniref:helix-turn-helix domain-containing protein n=1 Tax=Marinilactibacillus kalidii TaxID=2820274 RepID=UPI001ABE480E|nr:helix-turn-helix domain-containing protein [Marinilactibacillus kalidii]